MSSFTDFAGGSGGGSDYGYEFVSVNNTVLEAGKKYIINKNVTNVILPDTSTLSAGDMVNVKFSARENNDWSISAFNITGDSIITQSTIIGAAALEEAVFTATDDSDLGRYNAIFLWDGVYWEYLDANANGDGYITPPNSALSIPPVEFTESGTFTPANSGTVYVTMTGGGGTGAVHNRDTTAYRSSGGGGSAYIHRQPVSVTGGTTYTVTVGAKGVTNTDGGYVNGVDGGKTSFGDDLLFCNGGGGGSFSTSSYVNPNQGTYGGNLTVNNGLNGQLETFTNNFTSPVSVYNQGTAVSTSKGGSPSAYGDGQHATNNSGTSDTSNNLPYGSGGGGRAASNTGVPRSGGNGYVKIEYI